MSDLSELLQRQAEWQRSLRHLPWPEKLRMAAKLVELGVRRFTPLRTERTVVQPKESRLGKLHQIVRFAVVPNRNCIFLLGLFRTDVVFDDVPQHLLRIAHRRFSESRHRPRPRSSTGPGSLSPWSPAARSGTLGSDPDRAGPDTRSASYRSRAASDRAGV